MPLTKQNGDAVDFCEQRGLRDTLDLAVEIVNETFPEAESVTVEVEQDPDSQHRWLIVNALVRGNAKDVRLRHRDCARRLVKLLEWPQSTLIRTTYTLA